MNVSDSVHCHYYRHIALDLSHLEKREQLLVEETSRRAVNFITKKEQLAKTLNETEVSDYFARSDCMHPHIFFSVRNRIS